MKNVKRIEFRLVIEGNGIVNFDSGDQKFIFNGTNLNKLKSRNDNVNYAKKNFYTDDKGELTYKIKISSNSLRHQIFKDTIFAQTPNVRHDDIIFISYLANQAGLLRGYMDAPKNGETVKHKGGLCITSAEQINNAVSQLEFFANSGEKDSNSLFSKETVGDIAYQAIGSIDVRELQFLSCDKVFGRYGINPDSFELYKMLFKTKMPSYDGNLGYYKMVSSYIDIPEYGIKIGNQTTVELIKWLFINMLEYYVGRSNAYARTQSLEYRYITNGTNPNLNPWTRLDSSDDIDVINFDVSENYVLTDSNDAKKLRDSIDLAKLKADADSKQEKLLKDTAKAKVKEEIETKKLKKS